MEAGEGWLEAARRELGEELAMEAAAVGALLFSVHDEGSPFVIHFVEVEATGEPLPAEHSTVGWYTPSELGRLPLAPADGRFVRARLLSRPREGG